MNGEFYGNQGGTRMRTFVTILTGFAILGLAAGCGGSQALKGNRELKDTIEMEQNGEYIEAMGIGAADPSLPSGTQRMATSRNAAVVDAEYQLAKRIKGVKLEGGITIEKAIETDSKISATVDTMVKGLEPTKIEWTKDDGCVVTLRIAKKEIEKQIGKNVE